MEFGKKVYAGNFVMMKKTRGLSKRDMERLRDESGIGRDVRKHLTRGQLPYIRVECVGGGWAVEFGVGTSMYGALDTVDAVRDGRGDWRVAGVEGENVTGVLLGMLTDTTVVGDEEYQMEKMKILGEYIARAGGDGSSVRDERAGENGSDGENDNIKEGSDGEQGYGAVAQDEV